MSLLEAAPGIDLLFTDVVMPGDMDGIDRARFAMRQKPGTARTSWRALREALDEAPAR